MTWRVPIPADLSKRVKDNKFALTILVQLLLRATNRSTTHYVGDVPVPLERGQCTCGEFELAKYFGLKLNESDRVRRMLVKLEKEYKCINKRKYLNCSIVTILNYDEIVTFEQTDEQLKNKSRANDNEIPNTNKNVKDENNVNNNQDALEKIERVLKTKYNLKAGKPFYINASGNLEAILNPVAFANSLSEPQTFNPIVEDSDFKTLLNINDRSSDQWVRASQELFPKLNLKYPAHLNKKQWKEANELLKK